MKKIIAAFGLCVFAVCLLTSCLDDNDDVVLSNKAVITAFSINDFGKVNGALYPFSIDHVGNRIYNRDSLPVGTDVSKVSVNVSFDGGAVFYTVGGEERAYSTADSIDFTSPVIFSVYAADGSWRRNYAVSVNVHKVDMDSLMWMSVDNENFPGGQMTVEKLVQHRYKDEYMLLAFGDMDGIPIRMFGRLDEDFKFSAYTPQTSLMKNTDTNTYMVNVDYSSIVSHEMVLYLLADGKLYSSLTGVDWTPESSERTFTSMVGVVDGELYLNEGGVIVACDPYEFDPNNRVEQFTHDWREVQTVDESLFPANPQVVEIPLATNSSITRSTLFGYPKEGVAEEVVIWTKLSTEEKWLQYGAINGNTAVCPALERITVIQYDGLLYAFGGKEKNGSLEPFEAIHTSADGGITWQKQEEEIGLPKELKGYDEAYACVVDYKKRIWLLCSDGRMFCGQIPRFAGE